MYHQAWPWGAAAASASPTTGFVQPTASTPVATTQWPAGYGQYPVTPELQQQWAAAWATQAQYAYSGGVPVSNDPQTTAAYSGTYPDYQNAVATTAAAASDAKKAEDSSSSTDKPKTTAEQVMSQDLSESEKIKQLKEQAQKWTSLQQPTASSWSSTASSIPASSNGNITTVTAPNDSSKSLTTTNVTQSNAAQSQMSKEEEEFERQFQDWEKQFETWKQQNQNHPDKEAFAQYEKQWQEWRLQLLQKKEQMQKAKAQQMAAASSAVQSSTTGNIASMVNTQTNSTTITDTGAATPTSATMYYQHPQYMYMQPYMYPGATTVAPAAAVPPAVMPPVVPPAVMPGGMVPPMGVPPTGMPPVSMQSGVAPPLVPQQMPFNMPPGPPGRPDAYNNQGANMPAPQHGDDGNYDNQRPPNFERDPYGGNYGGMRGPPPGGPRNEEQMGPNYEGFDPNMNMPEGDYERDNWNFGRGRGRGERGGRGRARGRGRESRWGEPTDLDVNKPGGGRNQRKTLLPGGPGSLPPGNLPPVGKPGNLPPMGGPRNLPPGPGLPPIDDDRNPFEYPPEDCRDEFIKGGQFPDDRHQNNPPGDGFEYRDGPPPFNPDEPFPPQKFDENFPPDQDFPERFPPEQERFPPEQERFPPDQRFPPDRKRFPPRHERFPPEQENFPPEQERFPPEQEGFPPGPEGFPPPGPDGFPPGGPEKFPPGPERFPPGQKRFPPGPERFSRGKDRFPPDHERFPERNDGFPPEEERFPPEQEGFPPDQERFPPNPDRFPPDQERFPPGQDRFPQGRGRFPPEDERFPPDDRFPPGPDRYPPPRHMMDEGGFGERDFNEFPPEEEMFRHGPPPFRDDFPPFDERGGRGRGRGFPGRGRRFRGEFDRFGPPFPPRGMRGDFPPDFPPQPDDRFGYPGDGPPRMPPPRGMRPPFDPPGPPFGPEGRFPDEPPFFGDGPRSFKSIDYTHRPAAAVMGDDYDPHYDYESEFQDDVNAFRDNFNSGVYLAHHEPKIFSQVSVESFDYGHGMKPMVSSTIEAKGNFKDSEPATSAKGFDFPYEQNRTPPPYPERKFNHERNTDFNERDNFRDRDRETNRSRDRGDRNRDRSRDFDRDRDRDWERDRDRDRERERDRDRDRDRRDNRDRDRDNNDRGRAKDRDLKRDRDWSPNVKKNEDEKRFKWDKNHESERDFSRDKNRTSSMSKKEMAVDVPLQFKPQPDIFKDSSETVLIEDILVEPKRSSRPKQLVIILRGLPGSGKTYFAKLIKDKEIENGGSAPRILSLDDYFMVETEVTEISPDTGKRVKRKELKFEYEHEMEEAYRSSLFKSFKKTIDDRFFPFIIVDAVNEKSKQYEEYWSYAKQKGFQVYIAEMDCKDPVICHKRNIHNRTLEDINKILQQWEPKPRHFISMDVRSLLQDVSITEVEMEVEPSDKSVKEDDIPPDEDSEESNLFAGHEPSRWEKLEATEEKLDQLDGLRVNKKKHSSMEDYLQLPDDYDERKCEPGKKRVRWADLEQRKEQDRLRAIGFVVGQTDWTKLTDPTQADKALTKTKYF